MAKTISIFFVFCIPVALAGVSLAQEQDPATDPTVAKEQTNSPDDDSKLEGPEPPSPSAQDAEQSSQDQSEADADEAFLTNTEKAEIEAPVVEKNIGLAEEPETPFFSVGARFRWLMVPAWFIEMFGVETKQAEKYESSGPLINTANGGPEFTYRKNGFDITAALWFANLGWRDPISFKQKSEDETNWEVIDNDLKSILITVDFIWSTSITDWFAITYGAGIGVGFPFGDIVRTEALRNGENGEWVDKCPCDPADDTCHVSDDGCEAGGKYGKTYDIPTKIIPWINLLGGVRFKPYRHLAIYVDGGFGLGFIVGTRVGYIF